MTAVYKVRATLIDDVLPSVVPSGVVVSFGPKSDQWSVGSAVFLGTSTDGDQQTRAAAGPGRKSSEEFEVPIAIRVAGQPTEAKNEAAAGEVHCAIQQWLDAHPRLYDASAVIEGTPIVPVPELEWAQVTRFEIDSDWNSTVGPITAVDLTVTCKARGDAT